MIRTLDRLVHLARLQGVEPGALLALDGASRLHAENSRMGGIDASGPCCFTVRRGWACSWRSLSDGRRQVVDIFLPGQVMGLRELFLGGPKGSFLALTEVEVGMLHREHLHALFQHSPQLGALLLDVAIQEQALLVERIVSIGRRSAAQRLGHFFLELQARLHASDGPFECPLNQAVLGDALGLSSVHVSRSLRQLKQQGLMEMKDRMVWIRAPERLRAYADFDGRYLRAKGPVSADSWVRFLKAPRLSGATLPGLEVPERKVPDLRSVPECPPVDDRPSHRRAPTGDEEDDRENQADHEEDPCNAGGRPGHAGQTECSSHNRNDQKEQRPVDHGDSP